MAFEMQMFKFSLQGPHVALCDLLKLTGVAESGGRGKQMVAAGLVKVDGQLELRKTAKIHAGQKVAGDGWQIEVSHG